MPRSASSSSTSRKLSVNRWYNKTAWLMISGGKRWRRYSDSIGQLSPTAVNLTMPQRSSKRNACPSSDTSCGTYEPMKPSERNRSVRSPRTNLRSVETEAATKRSPGDIEDLTTRRAPPLLNRLFAGPRNQPGTAGLPEMTEHELRRSQRSRDQEDHGERAAGGIG